ncbi:uncharacterized protein LOC116883940 [Rattus rattus]|uniref:uncharacterized protein LOC116883940 n=1 Tax=Rattus rattus TaxID=10117 RepID=UPI0013F2E57E|nr:uncharacterized protein LOC116883940 [Rattus rattus]
MAKYYPWKEGFVLPVRKINPKQTPPAPLAAAEEKKKLPPNGPSSGDGGQSREADRVRRGGGGGYRSALRPIVSLPGGSRQSRAREPGSSPARHLLPPPLWKRPPPSPGRLARDPASAPPAPPASPAANSRRCGRGRRHLGAGGQPLPSRRHVRCSRAPAGRAPAGLQGEATCPSPSAGRRCPRTRQRREIAPELRMGLDQCCV